MTASVLELAGLLAGCGAAATAIVARDRRLRHAALGVALIVAPALVAGDVWDEERVVRFREDAAAVAAALVAVALAIAALAALMRRLPTAFPILAFALLPLRVPVEIGGETANLLIPLYLVIASATVATAWRLAGRESHEPGSPTSPPVVTWLKWALAATLVLYAIQSAYSEDVSNAIENAGFFLIPFAALFVLLQDVRWTRRLLGQVLIAVGAVAALFALIAIYQSMAKDLFLNDELFASNQIHLYFRVNSLFFDPNVLGRYLALAIVALAAYLAWGADPLKLSLAGGAAAISLAGLVLSFSITSFLALLVGLGAVALLRWGWRGALGVAGMAAAALVVLLLLGGTPSSDIEGVDRDILDESGRGELAEGGLRLAEDRPLGGWGAGSFGVAFYEQEGPARTTVASHSEPITVAAEQGGIGLVVYVALLITSLAVLLGARPATSLARSAVAACFIAMIAHSMGYAGFAIDPATWALLALGVAVRAPAPGPD